MSRTEIRHHARQLRREGKTYREICDELGQAIPKGTLSGWFRDLSLSMRAKAKLSAKALKNLQRARVSAKHAHEKRRKEYLDSIRMNNAWAGALLEDSHAMKLAMAMLYLGEGKKQGGGVSLGNSNPEIIKIFLGLLRRVYEVDEHKFRVTVQCRADQDVKQLEAYWSTITKIPREQFYPAQIDPRSVGKPSRKKGYKGVCRIDYFSAHMFNELAVISELLARALSSAG